MNRRDGEEPMWRHFPSRPCRVLFALLTPSGAASVRRVSLLEDTGWARREERSLEGKWGGE